LVSKGAQQARFDYGGLDEAAASGLEESDKFEDLVNRFDEGDYPDLEDRALSEAAKTFQSFKAEEREPERSFDAPPSPWSPTR
jgi:hypothetical protein